MWELAFDRDRVYRLALQGATNLKLEALRNHFKQISPGLPSRGFYLVIKHFVFMHALFSPPNLRLATWKTTIRTRDTQTFKTSIFKKDQNVHFQRGVKTWFSERSLFQGNDGPL